MITAEKNTTPISPPSMTAILKAAESLHETSRLYNSEILMGDSQAPWSEASEEQKQCAIDKVAFAIANSFPNPDANLPENERRMNTMLRMVVISSLSHSAFFGD
jgi:hypothetical protein